MIRTSEDVERERVLAWIEDGRDEDERRVRGKACQLATRISGSDTTREDCVIIAEALVSAHQNPVVNHVVKVALQKAERALSPVHARKCAARELMMQKKGLSENDRRVIDRTCDCNVTPEDALLAVQVALGAFVALPTAPSTGPTDFGGGHEPH